MFLMYLRLPHRQDPSSNDSEAFNSPSNRAMQHSPDGEGRSLQTQRQQAQQLRQIQATYYLERRLF
jgi:hypothetical protein